MAREHVHDTPYTHDAPIIHEERVGVFRGTRDQIRWGPVFAGVIVTLASLVVLSILGFAIGLTAFEAGGVEGLAVAGMIYGVIIALIAFFLGGFTAGRTASVSGPVMGTFNGAMVWATSLVLALFLTVMGAGAAMGMVGVFGMEGAQPGEFFAVGDAQMQAWWTFIAMLGGLAVAAIGGLVGAPKGPTGVERAPHETTVP